MVEQWSSKPKVMGSSPIGCEYKKLWDGVAVSSVDSCSEGRGFESLSHNIKANVVQW